MEIVLQGIILPCMLSQLNSKQKSLYSILALNFIVSGIVFTIYGATLPQIIDGFHWDYLTVSVVLACLSVGSFLTNLICGFLLKKVQPKGLLAGGLAFTALGLFFFGRWSNPWLNGFFTLLVGVGQGATEVITNSIMIRFEKPGESRLMNLMQAAFGIGAVVGPVLAGILAACKVPFTLVFFISGLLQLLVAGLFLLQIFPDLKEDKTSETETTAETRISIWKPALFLFVTGLFLYVGVELTMSNWISEYFARIRGFAESSAALLVSVYWFGLFVGRLVMGLVPIFPGRQEKLLAILTAVSVFCYVATVVAPLPIIATFAAFLTGLCFSGCYPIMMILVGKEFKGSTTALGVCAMAGGIGLLVFPLLVGSLAKTWGLGSALLVAALVDCCLALVGLTIYIRQRKKTTLKA